MRRITPMEFRIRQWMHLERKSPWHLMRWLERVSRQVTSLLTLMESVIRLQQQHAEQTPRHWWWRCRLERRRLIRMMWWRWATAEQILLMVLAMCMPASRSWSLSARQQRRAAMQRRLRERHQRQMVSRWRWHLMRILRMDWIWMRVDLRCWLMVRRMPQRMPLARQVRIISWCWRWALILRRSRMITRWLWITPEMIWWIFPITSLHNSRR